MTQKTKRHRSPAYPSIGLEAAIERAMVIWQHERRTEASVDVLASHWGYKPNSANAMRCIAALKQYGLLVDIGDRGDRSLRLSDRALAILLDDVEGSPERSRAIAEAALAPKLYRSLWDERKDGSEANLRTHLVRDLEFNPTSVDALIRQYKNTISFAKLGESGIIDGNGEDGGNSQDDHKVVVGAYVQWTSEGAMRFREPRCVTGISDDGEWAFVEGSRTGVPVSELTIDKKPAGQSVPPDNPDFGETPPEQRAKEFPLYLSCGRRALLRVPEQMTESDFELLKTQLDASLSVTKATTNFVDKYEIRTSED